MSGTTEHKDENPYEIVVFAGPLDVEDPNSLFTAAMFEPLRKAFAEITGGIGIDQQSLMLSAQGSYDPQLNTAKLQKLFTACRDLNIGVHVQERHWPWNTDKPSREWYWHPELGERMIIRHPNSPASIDPAVRQKIGELFDHRQPKTDNMIALLHSNKQLPIINAPLGTDRLLFMQDLAQASEILDQASGYIQPDDPVMGVVDAAYLSGRSPASLMLDE